MCEDTKLKVKQGNENMGRIVHNYWDKLVKSYATHRSNRDNNNKNNIVRISQLNIPAVIILKQLNSKDIYNFKTYFTKYFKIKGCQIGIRTSAFKLNGQFNFPIKKEGDMYLIYDQSEGQPITADKLFGISIKLTLVWNKIN